MKEDVIHQVHIAEEQAEQKLQNARVQAEKILHDARHQAVEDRTELISAAHKNAKDVFEQGVTQFEPELAALRQQFQNEIAQDSARAHSMFEHVVEYVVSEFQTRFGQNQ